jgi:hypothetical protein
MTHDDVTRFDGTPPKKRRMTLGRIVIICTLGTSFSLRGFFNKIFRKSLQCSEKNSNLLQVEVRVIRYGNWRIITGNNEYFVNTSLLLGCKKTEQKW